MLIRWTRCKKATKLSKVAVFLFKNKKYLRFKQIKVSHSVYHVHGTIFFLTSHGCSLMHLDVCALLCKFQPNWPGFWYMFWNFLAFNHVIYMPKKEESMVECLSAKLIWWHVSQKWHKIPNFVCFSWKTWMFLAAKHRKKSQNSIIAIMVFGRLTLFSGMCHVQHQKLYFTAIFGISMKLIMPVWKRKNHIDHPVEFRDSKHIHMLYDFCPKMPQIGLF